MKNENLKVKLQKLVSWWKTETIVVCPLQVNNCNLSLCNGTTSYSLAILVQHRLLNTPPLHCVVLQTMFNKLFVFLFNSTAATTADEKPLDSTHEM